MTTESELNFIDIKLCDRSFAGQDLTGAMFRGADLRGVNFTKTTLRAATFTRCRTGLSAKQNLISPIVVLVSLLLLFLIGFSFGSDLFDPHRQVSVASNQSDGWVYSFLLGAIVVIGGLVGFGAEKLTQIRNLGMVGIAGGGVGEGLGLFSAAVFYLIQALVTKHRFDIFAGVIGILVSLGMLGFALYCGVFLYRDRTGTDFGEADLTGAHFSLMRLQNCNFAGATLAGVNWADSEFKFCEFKDSNNKLVSQPPIAPSSVDDSLPRSPD